MNCFLYAVTVTQQTALGLLPYAVITATSERVRVWVCTEGLAGEGTPERAELDARLGDAYRAAGMQVSA